MASSHDDLPAPPPPPATVSPEVPPAAGEHANADPLTNEPGAHPVGVGAAGAGAVGALIGAVMGPVGALVGSVVGALAGAVVGKETAETVNPTEPSALAKEVDEGEETVADELPAAPGALGRNVLPAAPPDLMTTDASLAYLGGVGSPAFLAAPTEPVAADAPPPEPMAEPVPPPAMTLPPGGSRLRKIVLAGGRAAPPPLEVTAQTAYPEDRVRDAAYLRYLERQRAGVPGDELDDWTAAEREVLRG